MRRIGIVRLGIVVAGLTVAAAACSESTVSLTLPETTVTTSTTTVPQTTTTTAPIPDPVDPVGPRYGGRVVIGEDQEPPTLNPYAEGGDNFIVGKIGQAIHTGVFDVDAATRELIPEVVVELPTIGNGGLVVNADGTMTVRYQIVDEAQWADGVPISGDDFAFTLSMILDNEIEIRDAPYDLIDEESIVVGDKTFEFTMTQATVLHENLFATIIPKHDVEGTNFLEDWHREPWVAAGPFQFESWSPFESLTLVRNDNYWKTASGLQLPYLDRVEFRFIPETDKLLNGLSNAEIDVVTSLWWDDSMRRMESAGVTVDVGSGAIWEHLNFQFGVNNRNPDSLNEHLLFRRAIAHAIDRRAIVDDVQGGYGSPLDSFVEVFTPGISTRAWARYDYNPDEARRLLDELCAELERDCVANPPTAFFSTTSNGDVRVRLADLLRDMLADIGVDLQLDLEDSARFFGTTLDRGDWDVGLWAWVGSAGWPAIVQILDIFDPDGPPPDGQNFYRWGTPEVTGAEPTKALADPNQGPSRVIDEHTARFAAIVDEANSTVDANELTALIKEAESILADQVVIIPLFARLDLGAYWADRLAGYQHNSTFVGPTWNIEHWYRLDE